MSDAPAAPPSAIHAPSLAELFVAFAKMSLYGFGGVLPWTRRIIVEEKRWMTPEQFNEAFSLSQFLPGPNVVNLSVVFGSRFRGIPGGLVALVGLIGPPVVIVTALGMLYARFGEIEPLRRILTGVAAAAVGLFIAVTVKMAEPVFRRGLSFGPVVAVAAFVAVGILRWPLPWVLAVLAPLSIALAWWKTK